MIDVDEVEPIIQEEQQPVVENAPKVEYPLIEFIGSKAAVEEEEVKEQAQPVEIEIPVVVVEEPVLSEDDKLKLSYQKELAEANI